MDMRRAGKSSETHGSISGRIGPAGRGDQNTTGGSSLMVGGVGRNHRELQIFSYVTPRTI
eukprot:749489-Hanusia_phi.AAC.8